MLCEMLAHVEARGLRPPIGEVFPFDALPRALARMREGALLGKIVVAN